MSSLVIEFNLKPNYFRLDSEITSELKMKFLLLYLKKLSIGHLEQHHSFPSKLDYTRELYHLLSYNSLFMKHLLNQFLSHERLFINIVDLCFIESKDHDSSVWVLFGKTSKWFSSLFQIKQNYM